MRTHRLLDLPDAVPRPREAPGVWIPALLEHGDSSDLRWLFATYGRQRVERWVIERGARQLSRRSRIFWERTLDCAAGPPAELAEALWPL